MEWTTAPRSGRVPQGRSLLCSRDFGGELVLGFGRDDLFRDQALHSRALRLYTTRRTDCRTR